MKWRHLPSCSCVVLLSGGLDSATCLADRRSEGLEVLALSFDYGQRHRVELERARGARRAATARARTASCGSTCRRRGGLRADRSGPVPFRRTPSARSRFPSTYVPARNTLFLAHALAWAEAVGAREIFIGANALDYSGYPDCRPEFLERLREDGQPRDEGGRRGNGASGSARRSSRLTKAEIVGARERARPRLRA